MSLLKEEFSFKLFGGFQKMFSHPSTVLGCSMKFGVYLPPQAAIAKLPVLYWLPGLGSNEIKFVEKSGAQRYAAEHSLILVNADVSPRGLDLMGEKCWEIGDGAGFYVDATQEPWNRNYRMYSYITKELIDIINTNFNVTGQQSIFGHSMGGHGAMVCAIKNPDLYQSVSAFAPICNPSNATICHKAYSAYLGPKEAWSDWDITELVLKYDGRKFEILIDMGTDDFAYKSKQLLPESLINVCGESLNVALDFRWREGYDHNHFFITTFIEDHIKYHSEHLTHMMYNYF